MIKSNTDLVNGINRFLKSSQKNDFSKGGVTIDISEKSGKYFGCKIQRIHYWLLFQNESHPRLGKSFLNLRDDKKDQPSVVQFTIDNSNFSNDGDNFTLIQNRGTTIGKKIIGLEDEFKALMHNNGFNKGNIVASGNSKKPNYDDILEQLLQWLRIRVKTKMQLEEKYRNVEDKASETEADEDFSHVLDVESKTEGGKKLVISVRRERNSKLRTAAIQLHGLKCKACGFDFFRTYGSWGRNYIEVHHAIPFKDKNKRETNPKTDLTVVCSNCHRMIHRKKNITLTIEELKAKFTR